MVYIVLFNNGRVMEVPSGEAKVWAMLSFDACNCNVYPAQGVCFPLAPADIK